MIKIYAVCYNRLGRKDVGLRLKESMAIYLTDTHAEGYDHNLKVKEKGFENGRWVYPLAIFAQKKEARAYQIDIMFDNKFKGTYILPIEVNLKP